MSSKPRHNQDELTPEEMEQELGEGPTGDLQEEESAEETKSEEKHEEKPEETKVVNRQLNISVLSSQTVLIPIEGITHLSMNRLSQTARDNIRNKSMGLWTRNPPPVHPITTFCESIYCRREGDLAIAEAVTPFIDPVVETPIKFKVSMRAGFPAAAFKDALVSAAIIAKNEWGLRIGDVQACVQVLGENVPVTFERVELHEPFPKTKIQKDGKGGATVYQVHARFHKWGALLLVKYYPSRIDLQTLLALFTLAGDIIGVGADRIVKGRSGGVFCNCPSRPVQTASREDIDEYIAMSYESNKGATLIEPKVLKLPKKEVKSAETETGKAKGKVKAVAKADQDHRGPGRPPKKSQKAVRAS